MAIYLIDYENTGVKGLAGIEKLKEEDQIILFYGPKTGAIPFDEHVKISQSASHVEYIKTTKTAKNYLDFQLTTYLGYLIASTPVKEYHVISKDSGYDSVIDFWSKKGLVIKRQDTLAGEQKSAGQTKNTSAGTQKRKREKIHNRKAENQKQTQPVTESGMAQNREEPAFENAAMQTQMDAVVAVAEGVGHALTEMPEDAGHAATEKPEKEDKEDRVAVGQSEKVEKEKQVSAVDQGNGEKERPVPKSVPESVRKKIRAVLKTENLQGGVYKQIYACMLAAYDKQTFNTALVRTFTQEKGNHYYKTLLQIFQEWKQKG